MPGAVSPAGEYSLGAFASDLYNFDQVAGTFSADLWLWSNYFGEETDFNSSLDFTNAISVQSDEIRKPACRHQELELYAAESQRNIQIRMGFAAFPVRHRNSLFISIEDFRNTNAIRFILDYVNSKILEVVRLDEWKLSPLSMTESTVTYNTNFGDEDLDGSRDSYSRVCIKIIAERNRP